MSSPIRDPSQRLQTLDDSLCGQGCFFETQLPQMTRLIDSESVHLSASRRWLVSSKQEQLSQQPRFRIIDYCTKQRVIDWLPFVNAAAPMPGTVASSFSPNDLLWVVGRNPKARKHRTSIYVFSINDEQLHEIGLPYPLTNNVFTPTPTEYIQLCGHLAPNRATNSVPIEHYYFLFHRDTFEKVFETAHSQLKQEISSNTHNTSTSDNIDLKTIISPDSDQLAIRTTRSATRPNPNAYGELDSINLTNPKTINHWAHDLPEKCIDVRWIGSNTLIDLGVDSDRIKLSLFDNQSRRWAQHQAFYNLARTEGSPNMPPLQLVLCDDIAIVVGPSFRHAAIECAPVAISSGDSVGQLLLKFPISIASFAWCSGKFWALTQGNDTTLHLASYSSNGKPTGATFQINESNCVAHKAEITALHQQGPLLIKVWYRQQENPIYYLFDVDA